MEAGKLYFNDIAVNEVFVYGAKRWLKVSLDGFITNSSIHKEVIGRGDGYAMCIEDGRVTAWMKSAIVKKLGSISIGPY